MITYDENEEPILYRGWEIITWHEDEPGFQPGYGGYLARHCEASDEDVFKADVRAFNGGFGWWAINHKTPGWPIRQHTLESCKRAIDVIEADWDKKRAEAFSPLLRRIPRTDGTDSDSLARSDASA